MGELHLEIAQDRLVNDLKAKARMGKIAIGYRETLPMASKPITKSLEGDRAATKGKGGCEALVEPLDVSDNTANNGIENLFRREQDGNLIVVQAPSLDKGGNLSPLTM